MPTHPKTLLVLALCLPLALTACDNGGGSTVTSTPTSSAGPSHSASPTASPTPDYPVASAYVVTAKPGVSDKDLRDAVGRIAKLPGVTSVSFAGRHQLQVELSLINIDDNSKTVYKALKELGTVTVR